MRLGRTGRCGPIGVLSVTMNCGSRRGEFTRSERFADRNYVSDAWKGARRTECAPPRTEFIYIRKPVSFGVRQARHDLLSRDLNDPEFRPRKWDRDVKAITNIAFTYMRCFGPDAVLPPQ